MSTDDVVYTEHLHDPATRVTWGVTWPRFAVLAALIVVAFWIML